MRNVDKDRCVIILTNNNLTNHRTFTFPMRVLAGDDFVLSKRSLAYRVGQILMKSGIEEAISTYEKLKNSSDYRVVEDEFNTLGYEILEGARPKDSIPVFEAVTRRFPKSWNAWDSLGEAFLKTGNKKKALEYYRKSVKLNPKNESGAKIIKQIEAGENLTYPSSTPAVEGPQNRACKRLSTCFSRPILAGSVLLRLLCIFLLYINVCGFQQI